jgi:RNA polymerase sigma-70 factor, ECF subfamily
MNVNDALVQAQDFARPAVARILRRRPADTDDVLQEAALQALRHASGFRGDCAYRTWFYRIAINTALMHLRSWAVRTSDRHVSPEDLDLLCPRPSPEALAMQAERSDLLQEAVEELTPPLRGAVRRWLCDESTNSGSEKARRNRARAKLHESLAEVLQ